MKLSSLLRKFSKDKKGSTAIGLGLTFTMVTGATIGAIEIEQMQKTRNVMQDKLDATVLYLGQSEYKTTPQDAGEAYFRSTIAATDLDLLEMTPKFVYDDVSGKITGDVTFQIKGLMTGGLVAGKDMRIEAIAAPRVTGTVEISLVLDVSGSMGWAFTNQNNAALGERRIDGLFEAADEMFNVIYQNPAAIPAVAVIPYATSVDITDLYAKTDASTRSAGYIGHERETDSYGNLIGSLGGLNLSDVGMAYGGPTLASITSDQVTERDHSNTMAIYAAERYQSQANNGNYVIGLSKPNADNKIPVYTESKSRIIQTYYGPRKISPYWGGWYYGGYERPTMGVMPMTKNVQAVRDYVEDFTPAGGTAGHIGAAWGLYALTPSWDNTFDHPAGKPQSFDETTEKYLVIMTDGEFNSQKDPNMDDDEMYKYFQSICGKARSKGVRVFTVGLLASTKTDTELSECAGDTGKYYPADSRLQLVEAFKSIGRETGELRLSH